MAGNRQSHLQPCRKQGYENDNLCGLLDHASIIQNVNMDCIQAVRAKRPANGQVEHRSAERQAANERGRNGHRAEHDSREEIPGQCFH